MTLTSGDQLSQRESLMSNKYRKMGISVYMGSFGLRPESEKRTNWAEGKHTAQCQLLLFQGQGYVRCIYPQGILFAEFPDSKDQRCCAIGRKTSQFFLEN